MNEGLEEREPTPEETQSNKERIIAYLRVPDNAQWVRPFGLYEDCSGVAYMECGGCGCCSTAVLDEHLSLSYEEGHAFSMEQQREIAKAYIEGLCKFYGIGPNELEA